MTLHQFFCILHFCHTCSLCRVELVVQFPRGVRLKCYYAFFLVCCGCDTSYIVSVHIKCQASVYTLSLCRGHLWRAGLAKQETLTSPGHLVSPLVCRDPWMSTVVFYCWCHSDIASVLLYFTFLSHLFPLPCGAGSTVPAKGSTQVLLCLFPGVLWLWHFLYSVGPHQVPSLRIYAFVVSRAFMAGRASQAGDADSAQAPGLTSGLQGSVNVHRGVLLFVPQWQCISYFVFYIMNRAIQMWYRRKVYSWFIRFPPTVYSFKFAQSYFRPLEIWNWFAQSWIRPLSNFPT